MKNILRNCISVIMVLIMVFILAGCKDAPDEVKVTKIDDVIASEYGVKGVVLLDDESESYEVYFSMFEYEKQLTFLDMTTHYTYAADGTRTSTTTIGDGFSVVLLDDENNKIITFDMTSEYEVGITDGEIISVSKSE